MAAEDALADELAGLQVEQRSLWLVIPEEQQDLIVEYMDVKSLCRTDSAMTGVEDRKARQKALKGLKSVALNKWPHYSSEDNYKGLRWCRLHRINLQGFTSRRWCMREYLGHEKCTSQSSVTLAVVISPSSWWRPGPSPGAWTVETRWVALLLTQHLSVD